MSKKENFDEFNPSVEEFECYVERLAMYFEANDIAIEKQKSVFLSVIGAKYYSLLKSLLFPDQPSTKTYDELVRTLKSMFHQNHWLLLKGSNFTTIVSQN